MNSSEDIQSGIFLDIMLRPKKKYSHGGRHSIKSSICDTLIRKFGSIQADGARAGQEKTDFDMDWDTFKQLNWKQIMGIILVRDKGCERMLYLLETY